ncbi:MAG: bifunctional oligoribonuclease/PAP phosphatase NrnA [Verrucomicrobiae bacterium]|nr:bifunctional oligoribonuclease/PAP phosphatase NrnA [Verrucomicrobiae bacterium]
MEPNIPSKPVELPNMDEFADKFRWTIDMGRRFLVLSHIRPDGDAYGSMLALAHSLKALNKEVVLWNPHPVANRYRFLPGTEWIESGLPPSDRFDARIVVDTASLERVGRIPLSSDSKSPIINIDHHVSNPGFGDLVFVGRSYAACGEILFDLMRAVHMPISREAAECLFVAISTDTGSFQYSSVTSATFQRIARLMEMGIDVGRLSRLTYENFPLSRFRLLREVLQSVKFASGDRIGYAWLTKEMYARTGAQSSDSEGMIDHIRRIDSVTVAVIFEEMKEQELVRVSLRSKLPAMDVNVLAGQFGGGGHPAAAGANVRGAPAEVEKRILAAVEKNLQIISGGTKAVSGAA